MKLATILAFVIAFAFGCQPQPEKPYHIASSTDFSNTLVSRKFQTEGLVGLTTDPSDYRLMETIPEGKWAGNTIEFIDSVHFVSAYEAWCGNDCFTSVFGRYYFVDSLKVRFYTDSITRSGDCKAPTRYTKSRPAIDLYLVKTADSRLQLNHKKPH